MATVEEARRSGRLTGADILTAAELDAAVGRQLAGRPPDQPVRVALSDYTRLGLLELSTSTLRAALLPLLDFDEDSAIAVAEDGSWGMVVQRCEGDHDDTYQLESWGVPQ